MLLFLTVPGKVFSQLSAGFYSLDTIICPGDNANFINTSTGATSYTWSFPGGIPTTSTATNPSVIYNTAGTYTVTLVAANGSSTDTIVRTAYITVVNGPTAAFGCFIPDSCYPLRVQFADSSLRGDTGVQSWLWDFGHPPPLNTSSSQNPVHEFPGAGTYLITLFVTDSNGCRAYGTKSITLAEPLTSTVTADARFSCNTPLTVNFSVSTTGGVAPYSYEWIFNNGDSATGATATSTFNCGSYDIVLITSDSRGCHDTMVLSDHIEVLCYSLDYWLLPNDSVCVGDSISFWAISSPAPDSYFEWYYDTTMTSTWSDTGLSTKTAWSTTGTYGVRLCADYGPCTECVTKVITVDNAPMGDFTYTDSTACAPPHTVTFEAVGVTGTGPFTYEWDVVGSGAVDATGSPMTWTFTGYGEYDVTLFITDANGCTTEVTKDLLIRVSAPEPHIAISSPGGCVPLLVNVEDSTIAVDGVADWRWDFGDGPGSDTSGVSMASYTYTDTGTYTISLVITTNDGCVDSITEEITVGDPMIDFAIYHGADTNPDTVCAAFLMEVIAGPFDSIHIEYGDSVDFWVYDSLPSRYSHEYGHDDTIYCIDVTAYLNNCPRTVRRCIYIFPDTAVASMTRACYSTEVTFEVFPEYTDGDWEWNFGSGRTGRNISPITHDFDSAGVYNAILYIWGDTLPTCTKLSWRIIITEPEADFMMTQDTGCGPTRVNFINMSTDGGVYPGNIHYEWTFGPGIVNGNPGGIDSVMHPEFVFRGVDMFPVMLVMTDTNGCTDTAYDTFYLSNAVSHFLVDSISGCDSVTVRLTDDSRALTGIADWHWTYGYTGCPDHHGPSPPPCTYPAGSYLVQLTVFDSFGCRDVFDTTINFAPPIASIGFPDSTMCRYDSLRFIGSTGGTSYWWDFGDGDTATERRPYHTYDMSGTYVVTYVISDDAGCSDTAIDTVNVQVDTIAVGFDVDYLSANPNCPPAPIRLIDTSSGTIVSKTWILEGIEPDSLITITTTGDTIIVFYTIPGLHDITLIVENSDGCIDTLIAIDRILIRGPEGTMTFAPDQGCAPLDVMFSLDSVVADSVFVDFGDSTIIGSPGTSFMHTYTDTGLYCPAMILVDTTGCRFRVECTDTLEVGNFPTAAFSVVDDDFCTYDILELINNSSGTLINPIDSIMVSFGDGGDTILISSGDTLRHTYDSSGTYVITWVVINNYGCTDTTYDTVVVRPVPVANAGIDPLFTCPNLPITLGGSSSAGATFYTWTPTTGLSDPTIADPVVTIDTTTMYYLTVANAWCSDDDSVLVAVMDSLYVDAYPDTAICYGETVQLGFDYDTIAPSVIYGWSPADFLNDPSLRDPLSTPLYDITYTVTVECGDLVSTADASIDVYPLPTVNITEDTIKIIESFGKTLEAIGAGGTGLLSYEWSPIQGLSCTDCPTPFAEPGEDQWYLVTVTDEFGCTAQDRILVRVLGVCGEDLIQIGKAFTPNNDGINDKFYFRAEGIQSMDYFRIYNRWGEQVWSTQSRVNGWDGTFNNQPVNPDVYMYQIAGTCINGENFIITGNVTLIR